MYSHMDFSPGDGKLLASVGGNPDFMLTVWDWEREKTVLRSKAFSQDIYRVTFSPENANQLTTSGTGHIRYILCHYPTPLHETKCSVLEFRDSQLTKITHIVCLSDAWARLISSS